MRVSPYGGPVNGIWQMILSYKEGRRREFIPAEIVYCEMALNPALEIIFLKWFSLSPANTNKE